MSVKWLLFIIDR